MTYSSEDFERFYLRCKAEAMPRGTSIQAFCSKNKLPYNLFEKWYYDTRHRIVSVRVSAIYNTVISTCRMAGYSAMEYLKLFFRKLVEGERDYSRLMPQTIGMNVKSL